MGMDDTNGRKKFGQYFTQTWVAELLVQRHFPELDRDSFVVEPSCGAGAFLEAIPAHVPAVGVEIDPRWAEIARGTGRPVILGDFSEVSFEKRPTHIIGNPPYSTRIVDAFLERSAGLLAEGGKVGFIIPAYMFQTASRVVRWNGAWSLAQEMLPRDVFGSGPGEALITKPVVFATFTRDNRKVMAGFGLYREVADVGSMPEEIRAVLKGAGGQVWLRAVIRAMASLGGRAGLSDIYKAMEPRRPTGTEWWKEKVRQVLAMPPFEKEARGIYRLCA